MTTSKSKILFMMSGSIAAFKACQVLSQLVKEGHEVRVAATSSTFQFIGAATLEGLSGHKVYSDLWEAGTMMDHIHLTRWADFAVLCPATANTIAHLAHGFADDLIGAMALAWPKEKPFWIVPAMNHQMLSAPATQNNLTTLTQTGFSLAPTQSGSLACGEEGAGRMLEADEILKLILSAPKQKQKILITAGATREPIDGIRFISNVSTGQTAATIATQLSNLGWDITFMHGQGSVKPEVAAKIVSFESFQDLDKKIHTELAEENYTAVIHCAAVSDYSPENSKPSVKLSSAQDELVVKMKSNFKILPRLKEYSRNKDIAVVGFKLTLNETPEQTLKIAQASLSPAVDAIVANDWSQVNRDRQLHPGTLLTRNSKKEFNELKDLSSQLNQLLAKGNVHGPLS